MTGLRGSGVLLLACDDHAAVSAVADETGAFGGCDEDAAVDASAAGVGWIVQSAARRALPLNSLVDGDARSGLAHVNVTIFAVHDAELLEPRKAWKERHEPARA
jgi:hypothetical protein